MKHRWVWRFKYLAVQAFVLVVMCPLRWIRTKPERNASGDERAKMF